MVSFEEETIALTALQELVSSMKAKPLESPNNEVHVNSSGLGNSTDSHPIGA